MSTVKANTIEPASGGTVTITGAALTTPALGTPASGNLANCTGLPASAVVNTPSGGISATTVQGAVNELDTEKFDKAGGTITGPTVLSHSTADANSVEIRNASATGYGPFFRGGSSTRYAAIFVDYSAGNQLMLLSGTGALTVAQGGTFGGNVGVGAAPNNWGSYSAVDIAGNGAIAASSSGLTSTQIVNGAYYNGTNWIYKYTGVGVARYEQSDSSGGVHRWFSAPSGTAGSAISFTQAMALDVSGNLSTVGVVSSSRYQSTNSSDALPAYGVEAGSGIFNAGASTIGFSVGSSEQMRLTSTGLGIGTSSPAYKLDVNIGNSSGAKLFKFTGATTGGSLFGYSDNGGVGITRTDPYSAMLYFNTSGGIQAYTNSTLRTTLDASGNLLVGVASGSVHTLKKDVSQGTDIAVVTSNAGGRSARFLAVASEGWNTADAAILVGKNDVTNRGINSGGTINASGADAAEYECNGGLKIAKGQIVGFGPDGVLTDRFDAAIRFGVKSTDPHIVGGDTWGTKDKIGERPEKPAALHEDATEQEAQAHAQAVAKYQIDIAAFSARLEAARQQVDRIAYCGKVPCNVTGAAPGDYIVAVNDGSGGIKGLAVRFPTFDQYRAAVGRVNRILSDGRAEIAVIVH